MGGVYNARNCLSWHTGILHHKKVQSSTSTMLQVPEESTHFQNLSEQPRCLRSLWRETSNQAVCRKEEQKGGHHAEMQQLSRGSQYSNQQVSSSKGVNKEDPTSDKTGRCPFFKHQTVKDFLIATSRKQSLMPRRFVLATPSFHHLDNSTDKKRHVPTPA